MQQDIAYHGKLFTPKDIEFIKYLIANNPDKSRTFISKQLCTIWNWRQSNGFLKDMVCRGLLLKLQSYGLISLPPQKVTRYHPPFYRRTPKIIQVDQTPIECSLKDIQPLQFHCVKRTNLEELYNSLIHQFHYLGYKQHIGENLKYIVFSSSGHPIACIGYCSPAWYIGCRDRFIGWNKEIRIKNLHLIAYQTRFLILPWVKVKFLASHLLALNARIISNDWIKFYNHPIYFLETFTDPEKYKGTCYKAANWQLLGTTTGLGKLAKTNKQTRSIKTVFGYPLVKNFRELLCS